VGKVLTGQLFCRKKRKERGAENMASTRGIRRRGSSTPHWGGKDKRVRKKSTKEGECCSRSKESRKFFFKKKSLIFPEGCRRTIRHLEGRGCFRWGVAFSPYPQVKKEKEKTAL